MTTVGCLRCGVWYDPARPHVCGVLGDDIARALEARIVALERRVEELEAGRDAPFSVSSGSGLGQPPEGTEGDGRSWLKAETPSIEATGFGPKPRFDRKANHRRYMREWRARQAALRSQQQGM
jgi:hypothetical protein